MKRRKLLILLAGSCLIMTLVLLPFMLACAGPSPAPATKPIKLVAATYMGTAPASVGALWDIIEALEGLKEKGGSDIKVETSLAGALSRSATAFRLTLLHRIYLRWSWTMSRLGGAL